MTLGENKKITLALIEEYPQARAYAMIDENGVMISDNTFLLLKKQKIYNH